MSNLFGWCGKLVLLFFSLNAVANEKFETPVSYEKVNLSKAKPETLNCGGSGSCLSR